MLCSIVVEDGRKRSRREKRLCPATPEIPKVQEEENMLIFGHTGSHGSRAKGLLSSRGASTTGRFHSHRVTAGRSHSSWQGQKKGKTATESACRKEDQGRPQNGNPPFRHSAYWGPFCCDPFLTAVCINGILRTTKTAHKATYSKIAFSFSAFL